MGHVIRQIGTMTHLVKWWSTQRASDFVETDAHKAVDKVGEANTVRGYVCFGSASMCIANVVQNVWRVGAWISPASANLHFT